MRFNETKMLVEGYSVQLYLKPDVGKLRRKGKRMERVNNEYHKDFEGEPEIQFICRKKLCRNQ